MLCYSGQFCCFDSEGALIQFFSTKSLSEAAFEQRLSNTRIEKLRGNILDRNGIPFTNRKQNYSAFIKPYAMPDSESEREKVCKALGIDPTILNELTSRSKPLLLKTDEAGSRALLNMDTDWVSIVNSLDRYDSDSLAKHVIGYLNKRDRVGQAGIEKKYENELKNQSVFEIGAITDAVNKPIKGLGYRLKSLSGDEKLNVRLTLDYQIQKLTEEAMEKHGILGAVVVEDVVTGDILSMASMPDYDQNAVENYLDSDGKELFNKATAAYNLGSVFKIIDAAAFFENEDLLIEQERLKRMYEYNSYPFGNTSGGIDRYGNVQGGLSRYGNAQGGLYSYGYDIHGYEPYGPGIYGINPYGPNTNELYPDGATARKGFSDPEHYYCSGAVDIGSLVFRCSSYYEGGHGDINMERAFALPCNSYLIELGRKVGYPKLIEMAGKFGFGRKTGISEQGVIEARGILPSTGSNYSQADIANLSIGQGVLLATPLQVADMVAVVANGGIKNNVNIVDAIVDNQGKVIKEIRKNNGRRVISKSTADKIRDLMEAVTSYGTGTEAIMGYYGGAAGKTGSAETGSNGVVHAWFAGYFPASEPRYSIAVFVENGRLGGKVAAPVFAEIAKGMLEKGY